MPEEVNGSLLRRHIGRKLLALREAAGLNKVDVAQELEMGRSTLTRMEAGDNSVRFVKRDVEAILKLYGASARDTQLLLAWTAGTRSREKSWWHDYTEPEIPDWFGLYVALEDGADTIRHYEPELLSGLLQTREYAEQVTSVPTGYLESQEIQRRVSVRMERQSLLTRPRAPHLHVILNEAVLRRPVGGSEVMAAQLRHLLTQMQQSNVGVQVVPFSAGLHATSSGFTLLDFPTNEFGEVIEPSLAYVETLTGALYINKPEGVHVYELTWQDLMKRALDESASRELITDVMKGFSGG
ncbi:helix-turn-helix domain-containing protein [Actinocatenispora comari]|uniref:Transcriptional regulator n=1 Tax=Actinocatenispora comari TaxID=2807577 RepID=A0A8J4EQP6_9ACTN|nr:helix-turn-helix transcriptional regulator [Actinocatenispora comari]GIL32048.1 transcriptional regulator [Actinocatenispora comari]